MREPADTEAGGVMPTAAQQRLQPSSDCAPAGRPWCSTAPGSQHSWSGHLGTWGEVEAFG